MTRIINDYVDQYQSISWEEDGEKIEWTSPRLESVDDLVFTGFFGIFASDIVFSAPNIKMENETIAIFNNMGKSLTFENAVVNFDKANWDTNEKYHGEIIFSGDSKVNLTSESNKTLIVCDSISGTITLDLDDSFVSGSTFSIQANSANNLVINNTDVCELSSTTDGRITTYTVHRVFATKEIKQITIGDKSYPVKDETARNGLKDKQDVIPDLEEIRQGAEKGATAVQHNELNTMNNYVPYRSSASGFGNSTLMYNSNAMAFTGRLHVGSTSPQSHYNKGRFTVYDNTPSQQVSSIALLNYGGGGGCGVAIDMYNTGANGGIPSGRFGVIDNGNYSGYLQLQVKKSGSEHNPLLPAMNIVPVPAKNSLTTCVSFGQDEFNRVLFDLHKPEATTTITDSDKRWGGSGTTYRVTGNTKFTPRLLVAVGDIVSFNNFSTEATVTGIVSDSNTLQITTDKTLGTVSNANISVKKAYFKVTDENNNIKVYIDPYGKFGIGTGTPDYDLDVTGTINASSDIKIGGSSVTTKSYVDGLVGDIETALNEKQPVIPDLEEIRQGAEKGENALPSTTKYANDLSLTIDEQTYILTAQLKDQNGDNLGTAQTIDLPLETMVVGAEYDEDTKELVLTLKNGQTVRFSIADLVSGLQPIIPDLDEIREGASKGNTAVQPDQLSTVIWRTL